MATCSSCGRNKAPYRVRNPAGGFHKGHFCKSCKDRAVHILKAKGPMEYTPLMKNLHAGMGMALPLSNPEKVGSKAQYDRHRQAPPQCFYAASYRTVPLEHTNYPKKGPYNVPGALAVVSRIRKECAKKYAERGVRVKYRTWTTQSILTPKEAGLRPTKAEMALENPSKLYTITNYYVKKFGQSFWSMRKWAAKKFGVEPKVGHLFDSKPPKATAEANPVFKIVSTEKGTVGLGHDPALIVTVEMGKGTKVEDAIISVKNYVYTMGWGGTPTVSQKGRIAKFTFKEKMKTSDLTYEDYKEAIEGEGWAIGDYKDMLAKAATGPEKAMLEHILKEEQDHFGKLQYLMKEADVTPNPDNKVPCGEEFIAVSLDGREGKRYCNRPKGHDGGHAWTYDDACNWERQGIPDPEGGTSMVRARSSYAERRVPNPPLTELTFTPGKEYGEELLIKIDGRTIGRIYHNYNLGDYRIEYFWDPSAPSDIMNQLNKLKDVGYRTREDARTAIEHTIQKNTLEGKKKVMRKMIKSLKSGKITPADVGLEEFDAKEAIETLETELEELEENPVQAVYHVEQAVYVPSTKDGNVPISKTDLDARVHDTKEYLSELFGGYTSIETMGGYHSPSKGLVEEPVVKVTSFATRESYDTNKTALQDWLGKKAKAWGQESIGYEVEGDLMYMNPVPNRHYTPKERRAITSSPEFKEWLATRRASHIKVPEQGAFHAFMTDVGKSSGHRKEKEWRGDPTRADRRAPPLDAPAMKKYYHGLGKNPYEIKGSDYPVWVEYEDKLWPVPKIEGYKDLNGYILKIGPKGGWRWEHPTTPGRYLPHNFKLSASRGEGIVHIKDQIPELQNFIIQKLKEREVYHDASSSIPNPDTSYIPDIPGRRDQFRGDWF